MKDEAPYTHTPPHCVRCMAIPYLITAVRSQIEASAALLYAPTPLYNDL